jgi:hypothetical protein
MTRSARLIVYSIFLAFAFSAASSKCFSEATIPPGPCDHPVPIDSVTIVKPEVTSDPIIGHADFEVLLSLPSGPPQTVDVLVNRHIARTFTFDAQHFTQTNTNVWVLKSNIGETKNAEIHDVPGLNRIEVVNHGSAGCALSAPRIENGINTKSRAIVIGISNYNVVSRLTYAARDAHLMAQQLKQMLAPDDITIEMEDENAKLDDIRNQLQKAQNELSPDATFYFYFSGHGFAKDKPGYDVARFTNNPEDQVYLVPWAGNLTDTWSLLPLVEIINYLNAIQASTKIVIFDSCFTGISPDPSDRWRSKGVFDTGARPSKATGLGLLTSIGVHTRILGLMSTQPGGVSYEVQDATVGGVFTHFLLQAASDRLAYPSGTTLHQAADYAKQNGDKLLKTLITGYGGQGHEDQNEDPKEFGVFDVGRAIAWTLGP